VVVVGRQNGKSLLMVVLALWHIYALDSARSSRPPRICLGLRSRGKTPSNGRWPTKNSNR
jgi:hypothetical protein